MVKLAGWDLSVLQVSQVLVAGDSSGKDKRMGGNRQHSALKQAIYAPPLLCTAQLLQRVMNQQRVPAPVSPRATALCSVNSKRDSDKVH